MSEGSDVFFIDGIEDEVAEGGGCSLVLHEFILFKGKPAG